MSERMVQLLDMSKGFTTAPDGTLAYNGQQVDRGEMCYFPAPMEFPAFLRFWRRVTRTQVGKKAFSYDHLGTTLEVDVFQFGIKVYLRWDMPKVRGGAAVLKIIVEDADGMNTVETYERG